MSSCQSGYSDRIARLKDRIFDLSETKQVCLHPVSYINLLPSSQPARHYHATNPPRNYCYPSNQVIQLPAYKGRSVADILDFGWHTKETGGEIDSIKFIQQSGVALSFGDLRQPTRNITYFALVIRKMRSLQHTVWT